MATPVTVWLAKDGTQHASEQAADAHEFRGELLDVLSEGCGMPGDDFDFDAAVDALLRHYTVARKES